MSRIETTFEALKEKKMSAFVTFLMAGDPSFERSIELLSELPGFGVDVIEIGMPFTDPMADGPEIQKAGQRALSAGMDLEKVFESAQHIRKKNKTTPIVLMGYYNPIYNMGVSKFIRKCLEVGIDGLIVVDLPPEEDGELCIPARKSGLDFIRLATPTTDPKRLKSVLKNTSGFIYYVSVNGITGSSELDAEKVRKEVERIKKSTSLPVCVGFGIKTPNDARKIAKVSDGVVVGSSIVKLIANGKSKKEIADYVKSLENAVHFPDR